MQRKPNPNTLIAAFLALSAPVSIILLAVRNLYDDELFSLYLVTGRVRDIFTLTAQGDVHPPGMYLLAHLAWLTIPSFRWMNLIPGLVLYIGLAVFLVQVVPLFTRTRSQLCVLLLATLHPQLLMWATTYRWYSWWTGLALITLTIALQPRELLPTLSNIRALTIGLLLACLFYLNYITFIFALALAVAMFIRYRSQSPKSLLPRTLLIAGVFFTLMAPQLHTMFAVHIPDGRTQRYGLVISSLRLVQSIATSEAYLPWYPIAILAALLFVVLCVVGWTRLRLNLFRQNGTLNTPSFVDESDPTPKEPPHSSALVPIVLFGLLFFLLVAASGLGGRPRSALVLIPVLAPTAALILETLRPRNQVATLIFFAFWSAVGIAHLLGRYGLAKSTMNDRPEEVAAFITQNKPTCSVVVTYDTALAFKLAQANTPHLLIISPYRDPVFGGTTSLPPEACVRPRLYIVHSYLSAPHRATIYNDELHAAEQYIDGPPSTDSFSLDPDAPFKRSLSQLSGFRIDLASLAQAPDYRYEVISGWIDSPNLEPMRHHMPHFVSGNGTTDDRTPPNSR